MSWRSRARVLVVDDLADAADSMAVLLRLWGYDAEACYGGAAALEAASSWLPQAVLLDLGMPGVDGFQVAQHLHAQPESADVVVIAVTGYGHAACRSRARVEGFDHFLLKPVDPDRLHELLRRVLRRPGFGAPVGLGHANMAAP